MIRAIEYASCYVYSPAGAGAVCERSRLLRALLKAGDSSYMLKYALRVRKQAEASALLAGYFDTADVLVPVPGSSPYIAGDLWISAHLALALVNQGLGRAAWSGLRRAHAVRKSATAAPCDRPSVSMHYESFFIERPPIPPERIVLVDDVITKGRTLLAAASCVHDAFPSTQIRAFALLRTMGLVSGVHQLLDPCKGEIRWKAGDAHRRP
jgi:predicted amidophosphoribosyltransferase